MIRTLALALALTLCAVAGHAEPTAGPQEIYSSNGILSATLVAAAGKVQVGNLSLDGATYNGHYAGPALHVHPGDVMRLRLVNNLSAPTNLHFHGLRTSPLGNGDNAHLIIQPNQTFDYVVRIPLDHPIGVFWFHAHVHGLAEPQVMSGLSGTIMVEPLAPLPVVQRLFVLKDMTFDDDTGNDEIDDRLHGTVQSVNGALMTGEAMRPGETQLWHFTNQSANLAVHLALEGHRFRIIAEDGIATTAERSTEVLDLTPSSRVDVLVDAGEAGHYQLLAKGLMTGTGDGRLPDRVIGTLDVAGDAIPAAAAMPIVPPPPDLRPARIDARREVVFTQTTTLKASEQRFYVNGKLYDASRNDVRVPLGNIEEWTIRNESDDMHIFHIHQIGFQLVEINGIPAPFTGYLDTIRVPARGEVKLRMAFTDPVILGRFMFHCHVLKHEDAGMMANIEIYDPTPPSLTDRLSNFYRHVVWWWNGVPWSLCGLRYI